MVGDQEGAVVNGTGDISLGFSGGGERERERCMEGQAGHGVLQV